MARVTRHAHATSHQCRYSKDKDVLLQRMRKIEGQARGIQRMIEEDRYCPDIIQQLTALSHAADEVSLLLLQDHVEGCMVDAIREQQGEPMIRELMEVVRRCIHR